MRRKPVARGPAPFGRRALRPGRAGTSPGPGAPPQMASVATTARPSASRGNPVPPRTSSWITTETNKRRLWKYSGATEPRRASNRITRISSCLRRRFGAVTQQTPTRTGKPNRAPPTHDSGTNNNSLNSKPGLQLGQNKATASQAPNMPTAKPATTGTGRPTVLPYRHPSSALDVGTKRPAREPRPAWRGGPHRLGLLSQNYPRGAWKGASPGKVNPTETRRKPSAAGGRKVSREPVPGGVGARECTGIVAPQRSPPCRLTRGSRCPVPQGSARRPARLRCICSRQGSRLLTGR